MNAPTGTERDGAEIAPAPEANGFMEGREPGPEWGGPEKSFKEFPCANILNSTYQSFSGTEESEPPPFPGVLRPPTTLPPAKPLLLPGPHIPLHASTAADLNCVSPRATLPIPRDAPPPPTHQRLSLLSHLFFKLLRNLSGSATPRFTRGHGRVGVGVGVPFLSQRQESGPGNGPCGFDSPVTGQLRPHFPRAANPAPRKQELTWTEVGLTAQGSPPVLSSKLSAY